MTQTRATRMVAGAAAGLLLTACTMKNQEAPPLTGPSELGTSVTLTASPDAIYQDGASQSLITATVRDAYGQAVRNAALRTEIRVGGLIADFGGLSAKNVVTGSDGRATFVYTAPAPVSSTDSVDTGIVVDIAVTPQGTDFNNALARTVAIRLLPVGVVRPPNQKPTADFFFGPTNATEDVKITFDGSPSSDPDGQIVSWEWRFSDGDSGSGVIVRRAFALAGTYDATLTVTDDRGLKATTTKQVSVGANPVVAVFTYSPTDPLPNQAVSFNGSTSKTSANRRIVTYFWDFGDGSPTVSTASAITSHTYRTENTFTVTLTVTDDLGRTATTSGTVSVKLPTEALRRSDGN